MKKTDKIIIALLVLGGILALFYPDTHPFRRVISQKELAYDAALPSRYVSVDKVAKMLMESDPSLILVDVRDADQYAKYTLPGAMNIPLDSILSEKYVDMLDQDVYTVVLFSNGSGLADQAWLMLRSYDYHGLKVLKGGLNAWYRNILHPQEPDATEVTSEAYKRYLFRKGAMYYFTGIRPAGTSASPKPAVAPKPVVKRKKKEVTGGCG